MWSKIRASPSHTHSAFSPGIAATYRMFECGNVATRQCTLTSPPPIVATASPKSTCIVFSQVGVSCFVTNFFRFSA